MKYLIILAILLTGCSGGGSDTKTTVVIKTEPLQCRSAFYGDSNGRILEESIHAPDFDYYTEPGVGINYFTLDDSYCTIYLALGTNNPLDSTAATEELALINLISGIEDKVICVLPMTRGGVLIPMRAMMLEHCKHIIDPIQEGIYPLADDGVHLLPGHNVEQYASLF